ncbi:MAG: porin family protein [Gammaproteobacteria bacterium]|nr:porin family protein [Gammaproteobacteria bacterium]
MQGKRLLLSMVGFAAVSISMPSFAIMSVPNGWYIEGNLGSSHISSKTYPGKVSKSGFAGNANFGYKLMPYFGLEVGYSKYADISIKDNTGTKAAIDRHYTVDVAGKGILPFADSGVEVFAKLGAARVASNVKIDDANSAAALGINGNNSHNATGLYVGLGAQYDVMPELAFVGQWQRAQGSSSTGSFDLYTLGLSFIFD